MGDQPALGLPQMQLITRRLEDEAEARIRDEVEPDLMRRARRRSGDRAGKAAVDRAVQMTAQDTLDLRMAPDDFGKAGRVVETIIIHIGDARREWRVVHQDCRRPRRLRRERCIEPAQPLGAQRPVVLAGDQRVERNKPSG
jgi:hypothetical protein